MKKILNNTYVRIAALLVIGGLIGWFSKPSSSTTVDDHQHSETTLAQTWTCSMHPSVRQPEPGKCPICGMDLIPLDTEDDDSDPMEIKMSPTAIKLANIQTTMVGAGDGVKEIRLNGKVQADERKKSSQSAHIPGRIEQLLVNFTGEQVQKGQKIAEIYSPELVTAQKELFEANKIKASQPELYEASREKLKNWKLTDAQIDAILNSGKPQERFPLLADVSGIVLERKVNVGDYVMRGAPVYEVADLSAVWILFDVYESDMAWVNKNDDIEFTVQSLPGETFTKKITYIDPVIDPATRVAKARVEMTNTGLKLKPEMFATAVVKTKMKGKSEMVIPKSAVLWTGERSVVYIKKDSNSGVSFMMQEVLLGSSLGNGYIIKEGLTAGMEVVTNGAFTIDAAAQLAGKPSMMNPEGATMRGHDHGDVKNPVPSTEAISITAKAKNALLPVYTTYLQMKDALVSDNTQDSQKSADQMKTALSKIDENLFTGTSREAWRTYQKNLDAALEHIPHQKDIDDIRKNFQTVSDIIIDMTQQFKPFNNTLFVEFCPMADNNKGAYWISQSDEIMNPYFGASMLHCGEVTATIMNK